MRGYIVSYMDTYFKRSMFVNVSLYKSQLNDKCMVKSIETFLNVNVR